MPPQIDRQLSTAVFGAHLRQLCSRLKVKYVDRNQIAEYNQMMAAIGSKLILEQPEFQSWRAPRRGRPKTPEANLKPVRRAAAIEKTREALLLKGYRVSRARIAREAFEMGLVKPIIEMDSFLQQLSRGKRKLAKK
jgi:hypothetical protein